MILDGHVNIGRGELDDPLHSTIPPERILEGMGEAGIDRSVIFSVYRPSGYDEANREVARLAREKPEQFIAFARHRGSRPHPLGRRRRLLSHVRPSNPDKECAALEHLLDEKTFCGLKLHPVSDGMPDPVAWKRIAEARLPVLLHGGEGLDYDELERDFLQKAETPVILAHCGGHPLNRRLYGKAFELTQRYPFLYLNTAVVCYDYILREAATRFPDRLLFGSDAPAVHPAAALQTVRCALRDPQILDAVLGRNLLALLR